MILVKCVSGGGSYIQAKFLYTQSVHCYTVTQKFRTFLYASVFPLIFVGDQYSVMAACASVATTALL